VERAVELSLSELRALKKEEHTTMHHCIIAFKVDRALRGGEACR
jgi:hypothetical protein